MPFCFVVHQYLDFFPGQVHILEVSFDESTQFFLGRVLLLSILKTCSNRLSLLFLSTSSSFGIEWGQKKLADLDFADDLALLCHTQQVLQDMRNRLHVFGKKLGYVSVARRRKL